MVPQGGRRASGRRGGSGPDAEHLARQSPKNVAQARRFLGRAGAADRGDPPPASHGGRRCPCHRRVLRRPNSGALSVRAPGRFGPGGSQCRSGKFGRGTGRPPGGAANGPWKERFFSRAVCSPPGRREHDRRTGPDRRVLGRWPRQAGDVGWIANEADPGRGRAVAGAASLAAGDDPRGQGGAPGDRLGGPRPGQTAPRGEGQETGG